MVVEFIFFLFCIWFLTWNGLARSRLLEKLESSLLGLAVAFPLFSYAVWRLAVYLQPQLGWRNHTPSRCCVVGLLLVNLNLSISLFRPPFLAILLHSTTSQNNWHHKCTKNNTTHHSELFCVLGRSHFHSLRTPSCEALTINCWLMARSVMKSTWDSVSICSSADITVVSGFFISRNTSTPSITCVLVGWEGGRAMF